MSKKVAAIAVFVALALIAVAVVGAALFRPAAADNAGAETKAKADAFSTQVAAEKAAADKKFREDTTVKVEYPAKSPLRVLFAGDSVTIGVGSTGEAQTYREQFLSDLRKHGDVQPTVAATAGAATAIVAPAAIDAGEAFDLIVVELGTNDMGKTSPAQFKADYTTLIKGLRAKSPNAGLVCAGLWQPTTNAKPFEDSVVQACAEAGGRYRPLGTIFNTATNRASSGDKFHPNDAGHSKIASQLLTAIRYS